MRKRAASPLLLYLLNEFPLIAVRVFYVKGAQAPGTVFRRVDVDTSIAELLVHFINAVYPEVMVHREVGWRRRRATDMH